MIKKIKYISILSIIGAVFVVGIALFFSNKITASSGDNIRGWIWSENVGWIGLNSVNCDSDGNHITDTGNYPQCPTGTPIVDYGVSVLQPAGSFSGYGWSENVGWVNFAPAGPYPSAPNYSACLDWPVSISASEPCNGSGNYAVSGWARVVSPVGQSATATGGWDGWIKLSGSNYGVSLNSLTGVFSGWAWGGDDSSEEAVLGWSKINGAGPGGGYSSYIPPVSYPVTATGLWAEQGNYCNPIGGSMYYPPWTLHWTFDGGGMNTQDKYQIAIDNNSATCSSPEITSDIVSSVGTPGPNYSLYVDPLNPSIHGSLSFNSNYYWCIKVWGSSGSVSEWINSSNYFSTASHRWPNASFVANPISVLPDRDVVFTNNTTCWNTAGSPVACSSYLWNFGDSATSSVTNPIHSYSTKGVYVVQLNATDGLGSCPASSNITVRPPLPSWEEVPPTF